MVILHQMTPFEVGQVKAHMHHGLGCTAIRNLVVKPDGKSLFGETAIVNCMNKLKASPSWMGAREEGSGPPRKTTEKQDEEIVEWVLDQRGEQKVSVSKIRKQFPYLRKFNASIVEERLFEAELEYKRRREKCIVSSPEYLGARVEYCWGVKRKHATTLEKWAYTDGITIYLDRNEDEHQNSKRRALGTKVWRASDNSDSMHQDCIGPSTYSKAQGKPVREWGMLACGALYIHVLAEGEVMNSYLYAELVEEKFGEWCGNCEYLVCDHEACLRSPDALLALSKVHLQLVDPYPAVSQDFNAIENAWKLVRERLNETMPVNLESRAGFVQRLKAAVLWLNRRRANQLWYLSTNQKERCDDCLESEPPGGRTKW